MTDQCQAEGCTDNWMCRVKGYRLCPAHTRAAIEIFCRRAGRKQRGRRQ